MIDTKPTTNGHAPPTSQTAVEAKVGDSAGSRMLYSRLIGALFLLGFVCYGVGSGLATSLVGGANFLSTIADQAAVAISNARLFREAQDRATRLAVVNEITREASLNLEVDKLFDSRTRYGVKARNSAEPGCPLVAEDIGSVGDRVEVTREELIEMVNEALRARGVTV